jgi:hypothetical protein
MRKLRRNAQLLDLSRTEAKRAALSAMAAGDAHGSRAGRAADPAARINDTNGSPKDDPRPLTRWRQRCARQGVEPSYR